MFEQWTYTVNMNSKVIGIVFSCVLTSELNSSQSGYNHYYIFSDLRETDGAR